MNKWMYSFAIATLLTGANALHAADTYTIDPDHSYVSYRISHLGFSTQTGKWFAKGTLILDKANPKDSKVNVVIQMDTLDTGIPELNKHLDGDLFFNVKQFPTATFVSNKVDVTGQDTAKVHGILTLHGQSKPVTLDVKLNKVGISLITDKMTAGFTAHTDIKRSDFGVNGLLPAVGDNVAIDIQVEAYKPK